MRSVDRKPSFAAPFKTPWSEPSEPKRAADNVNAGASARVAETKSK